LNRETAAKLVLRSIGMIAIRTPPTTEPARRHFHVNVYCLRKLAAETVLASEAPFSAKAFQCRPAATSLSKGAQSMMVVLTTSASDSGGAESIAVENYFLLLLAAFSSASRARSLARRAVRARFAIAARAFSPFCLDIVNPPMGKVSRLAAST
jgi:hypothetical protein